MSAADDLIALAEDRYELHSAGDGEPYAVDLRGPNIARFFRGGRASLRAELAAAYATQSGHVPRAQALADALAVLEGRAYQQPRNELPLRSAMTPDGLFIDL